MNWTLPGSTLVIDTSRPDAGKEIFDTLFVAGGLILSQVCQITGLEPYTVQNWVKRGFLPRPEAKKYNLEQLCRLLIISTMKSTMPMEQICKLLTYVNGHLDDHSDDLIPDSQMYFAFVRLAAGCRKSWTPDTLEQDIAATLAQGGYEAPTPDAQVRVAQVLKIMVSAYMATQLQKNVSMQLAALEL